MDFSWAYLRKKGSVIGYFIKYVCSFYHSLIVFDPRTRC